MPALFQAVLLLVFPAGVIAAALYDATSYTIPNRLSAGLALAFIPVALLMGLPFATFGLCVAVGVAALAVGVAVFALGWMGGGDAKLAAACLLWLGPAAAVPFLLWTGVAGGALAVGLLSLRKAPGLAGLGPQWMGRLLQPGGDVPYGLAIAVGALAAFPLSPLARLAHGF